MVSRQKWQESLRRARKLLAETPEARARKRAAAERAATAENKKRARMVVDQMLMRERALAEINAELDRIEEQMSWLLLGKSRGAR